MPVDRNPLVGRARALRRSMTGAEITLWSQIRRRQVGARFRRQAPVGRYIADFLSVDPPLIVEVDGGHHGLDYDDERDAYLRDKGFRVLRVRNEDVLWRLDQAVSEIIEALAELRGE